MIFDPNSVVEVDGIPPISRKGGGRPLSAETVQILTFLRENDPGKTFLFFTDVETEKAQGLRQTLKNHGVKVVTRRNEEFTPENGEPPHVDVYMQMTEDN